MKARKTWRQRLCDLLGHREPEGVVFMADSRREASHTFCLRCGTGFAKARWHFIARLTLGDEVPSVWQAGRMDDPNVAELARYRWMWQARLVARARNRWTLKSRLESARWWYEEGRFRSFEPQAAEPS